MSELAEPIRKVRDALDAGGASDIKIRIVENATIFTVDDAAATIGVPASEILKSLIFLVNKKPGLVLMSGANKVDAKAAARALGGSRGRMMPPDDVFASYGFHVGGVPPLGYAEQLPTVLDEDLFKYETVWAAAGTDHAFFPVAPQRLLELTGGVRAVLKKSDAPQADAADKN